MIAYSMSIKQTRQNYLDVSWRITLSAKRAFHHFAWKLSLNFGSLCTQLRCQIKMLHKYLFCIFESLKVSVCSVLCTRFGFGIILLRQVISGSFWVVVHFGIIIVFLIIHQQFPALYGKILVLL